MKKMVIIHCNSKTVYDTAENFLRSTKENDSKKEFMAFIDSPSEEVFTDQNVISWIDPKDQYIIKTIKYNEKEQVFSNIMPFYLSQQQKERSTQKLPFKKEYDRIQEGVVFDDMIAFLI